MSIRLGSTLLAGSALSTHTIENAHSLFDFKWTDHVLNQLEWLRADTFSWQDGTVYSDAYNHLVNDIDGKTATSETIGSYTISYYLADDGHKITTDEATVLNIYNESGVAWYYVLDTVNTRFKLPRTKFGFTGLRDTVGKYVEAGLPNITGKFRTTQWSNTNSGAFYRSNTGGNFLAQGSNYPDVDVSFDASSANSIYGNSTTVQPPATQMYLYFYVGQFSQTATEQTAGLNSELFNGKADSDLNNVSAGIDFVVESKYPTAKDPTWYRLYRSKWLEQGGNVDITGSVSNGTIPLPKSFSSTNYTVLLSKLSDTTYDSSTYDSKVRVQNTDSFTYSCHIVTGTGKVFWEAKGMSASS